MTIAWLLPDEPWHGQAVAFREDIIAGALQPVVAHHFRLEVRHALVRAAHRGRCEWAAIPDHLSAIERMEFETAHADLSDRLALALCQAFRLSWADSQWVVLAKSLDLALVTTDMRLVRSVPPEIAWVEPLSSRPA